MTFFVGVVYFCAGYLFCHLSIVVRLVKVNKELVKDNNRLITINEQLLERMKNESY